MRVLDSIETFAKAQAALDIARTRPCPACGCYIRVFEGRYDSHHPMTRPDHAVLCEASSTLA